MKKIRHAIISSQEGGASRAKPTTTRQFGEEKNIGIGGRRRVVIIV
jgi:hypothetical protein